MRYSVDFFTNGEIFSLYILSLERTTDKKGGGRTGIALTQIVSPSVGHFGSYGHLGDSYYSHFPSSSERGTTITTRWSGPDPTDRGLKDNLFVIYGTLDSVPSSPKGIERYIYLLSGAFLD